jgi:hypothetical protein
MVIPAGAAINKAIREGSSSAAKTYNQKRHPWYYRIRLLATFGTMAAMIYGYFSRKNNGNN